jgi:hypothetical protein
MEGNGELALGMVEGEDGEYYHGCRAIGSTKFRTYLRSPREYWFRYVSGEENGESSESQEFGKVAHAVILEKEKYVYPPTPFDRRTKGGKEGVVRPLLPIPQPAVQVAAHLLPVV